MTHNSFGHLFRVTTWGESHGPALGCVVDGCPPGIALSEPDIQRWMDKRRPGQSKYTTQRREPDAVRILSGVFPDQNATQVTTGTPISLMIENMDQRSKDYGDIKDTFRPGHADYSYYAKYGVRDYRGGGRQSARETAARVAAGAIARTVLDTVLGDVTIRGALVQMGPHKVPKSRKSWDWSLIDRNPFWCPHAETAKKWATYLDSVRKAGSSCGAVIEVQAIGIPAGLGAPIYSKLDAELAGALMSINAVKGVEIGDGMDVARLTGEKNADQMRMKDGHPLFTANHAGGIQGGISTGQDIIARFAVKPTSSILTARKTVDLAGRERDIQTKGRHDPCVGIRAVPVGEAMLACVLADHVLRHRAQTGRTGPVPLEGDGD